MYMLCCYATYFFISGRRRHTRCAVVTGVQTCALPIFQGGPRHAGSLPDGPQPPYRVRWTLSPPAAGGLSPAIIVDRQAISVGALAVYCIDQIGRASCRERVCQYV